jgi:hypothetical protein
MTDKTTLSKHKYIYRVYEDSTGEVHCSKYPIIYLNSKVVYFKDARKHEYLANVLVSKIYDNFEVYAQAVLDMYYKTIDDYFWDVEGNLKELFFEFKQKRKAAKLIHAEKQITFRYVQAQKEFEAAKAKLNELIRLKENKND